MDNSRNNPRWSFSRMLDVFRTAAMAWKLFWDGRVPIGPKLLPIASLAYVIWPLDLLADPVLGLGQIDDAAVILLAARLFIGLCPPQIVAEYRARTGMEPRVSDQDSDVVDATYRVFDDDDPLDETNHTR